MAVMKRLFRRSAAGRIAGVCAGIAEYLDTDVTLVRFLWVVLSIVPGGLVGGVLAYIAAWIIMPDSTSAAETEPEGRRLTRSMTDRKLGGVCAGLAQYFDLDATFVRLVWAVLTVVPGAIVLGVGAYLVAWFIIPVEQAPRVAAASPAA